MNNAIQHALQSTKVNTATNLQIEGLIRVIHIICGLKERPTPESVEYFTRYINKYYHDLTCDEVELAFELVQQQVIEIDAWIRGRTLSVKQFTNTIRAYKAYKKKECPELYADHQTEYTPREAHELALTTMHHVFTAYKFTGDDFQITGATVRWLKELGITVPGSEGVPIPDPLEVVKQRIAGVKPESENDRAKDLVIEYFDSVNTLPL